MAWITTKPNGKHLVRWRDFTGRTFSRQFDTLEEAEEEKDGHDHAAKYSIRRRDLFEDPDRPQDLFENYLRRIIEADKELRESSKRTYLVGLKTHIAGTGLGQTAVKKITPELVEDFWAKLDGGPGVRRNVYLLMSKVFTSAIRAGIIDVSPLKRAGIKQPAKGRRVEVVPLTVDEIEALADGARCQRDRLAILLMAYGGLRAGEVGGLRAQDVDFTKCRISIRQQVVQVSGTKYISPLKTKSARRAIEVACSVTEELKALVETDPPTTDGRIFHSLDGGYWSAIRINEAVHRAAAAAGLPDSIHSHMLRHTAVSLLTDDGANIKSIQAFVGHANITETLQTYGHLLDFGGSALAASMEKRRQAYLNGPERPPDQAHATAINQ